MSAKRTPAEDAAEDAAPIAPWKTPRFLVAAAFVGLVAVMGVVVAVLPSPGSTPSTPQERSAKPGASADTDAAPLTAAPKNVTWELFGKAAVPVSKKHGPDQDDGHVATGFAHTPTGALLAAAQISVRAGIQAPRDTWKPTIEHQMVAGAARDQLLTAMESASAVEYSASDIADITGFVFTSFTGDVAVVELVMESANNHYGLAATMRWVDGDWRMEAPTGGSWASLIRPVADASGVVTWGAT